MFWCAYVCYRKSQLLHFLTQHLSHSKYCSGFFLGHLCKSTIPLKGRMFLFMSLNQTLTQTHMHKHTSPMFCHWTTAFCTKPFYPLYRQTTSSDAAQKAVLVDSGGFSNFQVGLWKSLLHFNPTQVASRWRGGILMKVSPLQWELRENLL